MAINLERKESTLSVSLSSGIGWALTFEHKCHTDADAEAWRRHTQAELDRQEGFRKNEIDRLRLAATELRVQLATERRRVAALRGVIAKRKSL